MSAPVVKVPNRDIFIPKPGSPIKTKPKQLGEACGSCNCPPTYTAGECEEGLDCRRMLGMYVAHWECK